MPKREVFDSLPVSEKLNAISEGAELLYLHMLVCVDDWGLIDASPIHLKMKCFPGRDVSVSSVTERLAELFTAGLLREYQHEKRKYASFSIWRQKRFAKKPQYPLPPWGETHCEWTYVDNRAKSTTPGKPSNPQPKPEAPAEPKRRTPRTNSTKPPTIEGFDEFWALYPRHTAQDTARKSWSKLAPDAPLRAIIMARLFDQRNCEQWKRENGQFIPHPATWINQRRWEDEPGAPASSEPFVPNWS